MCLAPEHQLIVARLREAFDGLVVVSLSEHLDALELPLFGCAFLISHAFLVELAAVDRIDPLVP